MRALVPGSFDPPTPGHLDVIRRAARMFDEVTVCILTNPSKSGRHPLAERMARLTDLVSGLINVTIDSSSDQLLVDYCRQAGIEVIVRGLRDPVDLNYELPMAQLNRQLGGVETLFLPADPSQAHVSSTVTAAFAPR